MTASVKKIIVDVFNTEGSVVGTQELSPAVFAVPVKEGVVHLALVAHEANARPMVASTKTRGEVRGGGRKPWKQKGTGRARHGSIRSPIWKGGGVVFGPRVDRSYELKINKKARRKAVCMVLSQKVTDGKLIIVDSLSFETPTTRNAAAVLKKLPLGVTAKKRPTIGLVSPKGEKTLVKSFRNIPKLSILPAHSLNTKDLLRARFLVIPIRALAEVEAALTGSTPKTTKTN